MIQLSRLAGLAFYFFVLTAHTQTGFVRTATRPLPPFASDPGEYRFISSTSTIDESQTGKSVACAERVVGSDGAVSVEAFISGGTATLNTHFTIAETLPHTYSWGDGVLGSAGCLTMDALTVTGDLTVEFSFQNAMGGIVAAATNQLHTTTIVDGGGGSGQDPPQGYQDYNSTDRIGAPGAIEVQP